MTQCPKCNHQNRPNAHFCVRCGADLRGRNPPPLRPLPAVSALRGLTTKVCPSCLSPNRLGARACARCGNRFATPVALAGKWTRRHFLMAGAVGALLAAWGGQAWLARRKTSVTSAAADPLQRALAATVLIIVQAEQNSRQAITGSGTIVSKAGDILTNFHVVGDPDTGRLHNEPQLILIAIAVSGPDQEPEVLYQAEVVDSDRALDLALLRIVASDSGGALAGELDLTPMPIGDSGNVKIGDQLTILGFPGLGGYTITLTRGTVAGFLENWIKTDAEINHGNSGGAAINTVGELVGIPSAGRSDAVEGDLPGKIGLIRPVNLARELLKQAR